MENEKEPTDKMLDVEDGPAAPEVPKPEDPKEKKMIQQQKLYEVMKALTAMKLTKEDKNPGAVFPDLLLGSIGAAYNKEVLNELGVTHILTCAANIRPRFENVSHRKFNLIPNRNSNMSASHVWILQTKTF